MCLKTHSKTLKCLFIYKTIKTKRLLVRSLQSILNSDRVIIVQLQFKQLAMFAPILVPPQRKNILLIQKKKLFQSERTNCLIGENQLIICENKLILCANML